MPPCRSTVATGEAFRLWKASLRLLCILRTLVPRCRWAQVSEVSPCMSTKTSAASAFAIYDRGDPRANESALREALPALYRSYRAAARTQGAP